MLMKAIDWPFDPIPLGGARAEVAHDSQGYAEFLFGLDLDQFNRAERRLMLHGPVKAGFTCVGPMQLPVFLVITAIMIFDLPFCAAINGAMWRDGLCRSLDLSTNCSIKVALVADGQIVRVVQITASPSTFPGLANVIRLGPSHIELKAYQRAVADYQAQWTPSQLLISAKGL